MTKTHPQKLNIAILGHKRVPSREGGIEVVVEELAVRMVERGHRVTCFNRSGHHVSGKKYDESANIDNYRGICLKRIFTIDKKGLAAVTSSFSGAVCAAFGKYDVVHFHAEGPAAMCLIPKLFGKRIIVTVHGIDWNREKWQNGFGSKYIKFGEKAAVKHADEIIVLSENVKKYFKDIYGRETVFIPNGITRPEKKEVNLITKKWGLEKDKYILFLGRIVPEKGLRYLVSAYKNLETDLKLVIAGSSSDTEGFLRELKELAEGDKRIIFTGFVQGQLLEELYSNAYLYVLPSDLEGMPLSLLEAMSYGNCCLVSDIPECSDVVEDKAVTFTHGDTEALSLCLQDLCDNPSLVARYKENAAGYICSRYNWEAAVDETLKLYEG